MGLSSRKLIDPPAAERRHTRAAVGLPHGTI